ncbi:exodeoxyribonuclease VII large subunit [Phyllobacterium endophyticum]|uniref:exodeoxyribonuclease VII large subunit n=1 Tax=Phyllobacterium endophyticum TaxID=1149773 RepID=UPI0011CC356C|nr:exodeoxyribonuclease VII large subunit [Phyllobacterium endophyticum]TXR48640.1 exodeoxyribonuclease VII large subunit [Phyllobacterium endophyticum]
MSEKPESTSNVAEFTVSEISGALKRTVEDTFGHIRVRGEISGYRGPHSSGHAYFSLKDDKARIEAVIWRSAMSRLRFQPEEGMEVVATGKLTTYPGSSKYQIVIEQMEPAGAGALMALLEERKRKLGAEGLFDASAKRRLPYMPRIIGVVTSPTGAVIRDIIHRIADRFPLHVLVWPVRVQGETAGAEVANAINGFNRLEQGNALPRPDVLIVARGGGSLEDLWGFNDEAVVRAVAASHIPIISAVGHETDWTLIDLAADVRAPTPTGAAEMAVPVKADLRAQVATLGARLSSGMSRYLDRRREIQRALARALPSADQLLALPRRRFDETAGRLGRALQANTQKKRGEFDGCARRLSPRLLEQTLREKRLEIKRLDSQLPRCLAAFLHKRRGLFDRTAARLSVEPAARLAQRDRHHLQQLERRQVQAVNLLLDRTKRRSAELERLLKTLSYQGVLERGFAVVLDPSGTPVKRAATVTAGDELTIKFRDGNVQAVAQGGENRPEQPKAERPSPAKKSPVPAGSQGSLF